MSLKNLSYEQTDWNTETRDNDKVLDATDFQDSIPYSDGSVWTGKSVSEMKTLLGLPVDKYIGYVIGIGSAGDTAFTVFDHLNTNDITLTFAKDGASAGVYNFTALSSLAIGKAFVFAQMNKSSDYSKNYSIEIYSSGSSSAYQLRVYKNGILSDIDNGDSFSFSIMMEDY